MKDRDFKKVFGRAPEEFSGYIDEALERIDEEKRMKKRYRITTVLIAAALTVLMAGAALAAGMGLIEGINRRGSITVPESAKEFIESDLGSLSTELFDLAIEEAIADGRSAFVQVRLTPKNPEEYALLAAEKVPGDRYSEACEYIFSEEGTDLSGAKGELIGRRDGKKVIRFHVQAWAGLAHLTEWDTKYNEDGSVTLLMEGDAGFEGERAQETAQLTVECGWGVHGEFDRDDAPDTWNWERMPWLPESGEAAAQIHNNAEKTVVMMEAAGESENGKLSLVKGSIEFSPIKGYYSLAYAFEGLNGDMWLMIGFSDAEGNVIRTLEGREHDAEKWTEATGAMQTFEVIPESIYLDVFDLMQDKALVDRLEVKLTAEEAEK